MTKHIKQSPPFLVLNGRRQPEIRETEFGAKTTFWVVVEKAGVAAGGAVQTDDGVSLLQTLYC